MATDRNYVCAGLGDSGRNDADSRARDKFHPDARARIYCAQVVDQLRQILDAVDVVMRRRRNQRSSGHGMAQTGDIGRDLNRWQLATFARLRSLRHLDFKLVGVHEVLGGHPEPARRDLVHAVIGFRVGGVDARIFTAFSRIAASAQTIHSNGQRAMGFGRYRTQRHCLRAESAQDGCLGLNLVHRQRVGWRYVEQVPDRNRSPFFCQDGQSLMILRAGELDVAMHPAHELGRGGMTFAVVSEAI